MGELINKIAKDVRVELTDEFDRNFERKAFFGQPWAPVKHDPGVGSMLMRTGMLRKSITARSAGGKIAFTSPVKYARPGNIDIDSNPQNAPLGLGQIPRNERRKISRPGNDPQKGDKKVVRYAVPPFHWSASGRNKSDKGHSGSTHKKVY